jgi:Protein of unknown function (DUF3800)
MRIPLGRRVPMHLVYIDEVKYQPLDQPYHWLGALAFPEAVIQSVDARLSAIAGEYFGTPVLDPSNEIHAKQIIHGKGPYKGHTIARRLALYKQLLDVVDEAEGLARIEIRIDPSKMIASEYADKAFMFLVEKVDEYMLAQKSLALLIADEDKEIAGSNVVSLSSWKVRGTLYAFGREITRIVDTIHHTRSHQSRLLQLADVYVYTLAMVAGDCSDFPRQQVSEYARSKRNLLFPTKYKNWPTDQSWHATA